VLPKGKTDAVFGAMWFEATVETDKDKRTVALESIKISRAKFSGGEDSNKTAKIAAIIEKEVPKWNLEYGLDQLLTSIKQEQAVNDPDLKNDPPLVIYADKPSTLILIDGDPKVQKDEKLGMEKVVNSPFLIVKEKGRYYLYGSGLWYVSDSISSGYTYLKQLPASIKKMDQQITENAKKETDNPAEKPTTPTDIIVSTVPAELIQTEGEPAYKPIAGTELLFATNTLDDIFKDIKSQQSFILISGRWYAAKNLKGPWTYIPADQLPADFAKIPGGSEKDGVLASVAGTDEAEDAKIDAQIPQTAKVERNKVKCIVKFDGAPKFAAIPNTQLLLAENADKTVMKAANGKFYALDNAIWFISDLPTGPYVVANERPADVEKIPASSAAYNTKYVYVYEQTPEYVYSGYTSGYTGSYIYGPTVVYGTGYYYYPWYGPWYRPCPYTWGFGFHYNPWYGWSMGFGMCYNVGWFHMSIGFGGYYGGGFFGPPYYRPPYRPWGYGGGYYGHGGRPVVITHPTINVNRPVHYNNIGNGSRDNVKVNNRSNIYKSANNNGIQTNTFNRKPGNSQVGGNLNQNNRPSAKPAGGNNNVLSDREGNIFQKDNKNSWNQRDNQSWKPVTPDNKPKLDQLNKDSWNRDRGNNRQQNFNRPAPQSRPSARPASSGNRMGGRRG